MVNEIAMLTDRMDIDIWEVIDAAATKPYGFMRFEPGPGMGGHCLPVDPFYLSWRAREFDMTTEFIELAGKVNQQMPYHCVSKVERVLNDAGKAVKGARISLFGVSYKPGVGDLRESPALKIMRLLRRARRRRRLPRPARAGLPERGLRAVGFDEALDALRPRAHRDRAPRRRPRRDRRARAARRRPARRHARRAPDRPARSAPPASLAAPPTTHGIVRSRILTSAHSDQFET